MIDLGIKHSKLFNSEIVLGDDIIKYNGIGSLLADDISYLVFDLGKEQYMIKSNEREFIEKLEVYALTEPLFNPVDLARFFAEVYTTKKIQNVDFDYGLIFAHETPIDTFVKVLSVSEHYPSITSNGLYRKSFMLQVYNGLGYSQPFNFISNELNRETYKTINELGLSIERIAYLLGRLEGFNDISLKNFYEYFYNGKADDWFYPLYENMVLMDRQLATKGTNRTKNYIKPFVSPSQLVVEGSLSILLEDIIKNSISADFEKSASIPNLSGWLINYLNHVEEIEREINNKQLLGEHYNDDILYHTLIRTSALTGALARHLINNTFQTEY